MYTAFELTQMQLAEKLTISHRGAQNRKFELFYEGDHYDGHTVNVPWAHQPRDGLTEILLNFMEA